MNKLTERQIGYLAGLVDGEGTIGLNSNGQPTAAKPFIRPYHMNPQVNIVNTNLVMLNWVLKTTGIGMISPKAPETAVRKPSFAWLPRVYETVAFLEAIQEALVIKYDQSTIVLEFLKTTWSHRLTEDEIALRTIMYEELRDLNRRGPAKQLS